MIYFIFGGSLIWSVTVNCKGNLFCSNTLVSLLVALLYFIVAELPWAKVGTSGFCYNSFYKQLFTFKQ